MKRSDDWFSLRQRAKVTGSTLYKAIGLETLQKMKEHFDTVICGVPEQKPSPEAENAMKHGTMNEPNALGTVVGKVIPVIYPDLICFEEGCVEILNQDNKTFMVISPDGSLRQDSTLDSTQVGIELKCPFYKAQTSFPRRYLLQCLAEIEALNVESLLYLSWTSDESIAFLVERDTEFFQRAMNYAIMLYGSESPKKPTKLPPDLQEFKKELITKCQSVRFIGLFKSIVVDNCVPDTNTCGTIYVQTLQALFGRVNDINSSCYNIKREKASEAMVFLCCDLDRSWEKNSIKSAPVCWFPKGYSLPTETLRKVAEEVHSSCHTAGIHVPAQSFDGQWHPLVVRSVDGRPLTMLQLQKDVWKEVERTQKSMIIKAMQQMNKMTYIRFENGKIMCTNGGLCLPVLPPKDNAKHEKSSEKEEESSTNLVTLSDALPDEIIDSQEISGEILALCGLDAEEEAEVLSCNINEAEWINVMIEDLPENQSQETERDAELYIETTKGNSNETEQTKTEPEKGSPKDDKDNDRSQNAGICKYRPTLKDAQNILAMLKTDTNTNRKGIWNDKEPNMFLEIISSYGRLQSLRDIDLRIIVRYFKRCLGIKIKESVPKQVKIKDLSMILDIKQDTYTENVIIEQKHKKRSQKIKSLKDLAASVLSKSVSKQQLNIAMAGYMWPSKYQEWIKESPLVYSPKVDDMDYPTFWFYQPDYSELRQQLEVRCIDSTHLLTRTRRKCCKGGLDGVSNEPWMKVAKSKKTFLSPIMIQEVVEPMSVMMALTHFSEKVETEMRKNGDVVAADLCRDVRHWWLSEDEPGLSAMERIQMRMNLRSRLLSHVKFDQFPPPTVQLSGWPIQLWEALIANIDAKSLLYAICHNGTYNVRAFSSMMGETFFSELTLADKRGHGTVTSEEFGQFIGTTIEQLHLRLDPERFLSFLPLSLLLY